jgi:hypothetical protein
VPFCWKHQLKQVKEYRAENISSSLVFDIRAARYFDTFSAKRNEHHALTVHSDTFRTFTASNAHFPHIHEILVAIKVGLSRPPNALTYPRSHSDT